MKSSDIYREIDDEKQTQNEHEVNRSVKAK